MTANKKYILVTTKAMLPASRAIKDKEHINKAFAGVGNPINESVCLVSILNFANLSAENTAIMNADNAINQPIVYISVENPCAATADNNIINRIEAGATPKLTASANESNSLPILEYALSQRAAKPSKKSKTAAAKIKYAAMANCPLKETTIDKQPQNRFIQVIPFGM